MDISDQHVAALRAYLTNDVVAFDRLVAILEQNNDADGFAVLTAVAFVDAAFRKFPSASRMSDVVRFVATVRSRTETSESRLDPRTAERLIHAVLGNLSVNDLADNEKLLQIRLLSELVADLGLDEERLDEFLARARERAEQIGC